MMILAKLEDDTIIIGLSRRNVELLLEGKPILKKVANTGLPVDVIIVGGETEESIMEELKDHFDIPEDAVDDRKSFIQQELEENN